ncbi:MAG: Quinoprotein glucose dehydrogenase precursor [Verrucomicrobiota bacterium]|jgi:hypothetical protein
MKPSLFFLLPALGALAFSFSAFANEPNTLSTEERAGGWQLLFDGKDPAPFWRSFKKETLPAGWVAEEGSLFRKEKAGDIVTKEEFENFELSIEWKISPGGNSGIMFRVQETENTPWKTGPEIQILDNQGGHDPNKAGWMYALYPASVDTTKPVGEWNHLRFVTQNGKCEHWMNGTKYVEYEIGSDDWNLKVAKSKFAAFPGFGKTAKGRICLQDHGNLVWYRNIKIRPLP